MIPVFIIILSVTLDQISKYIVSTNMEIGDSFGFIKHIINITYITNTGAAFGVLKDHRWVFIISSAIAILMMMAILGYFIRKKEHFWLQIALALMVSGGLGNMIDRVLYGKVIDFLEFDFVNFAIFNVADSCVTVGCAICIIYIFIKRNYLFKDDKKNAKKDEEESEDMENREINAGDEI